MSSSAERETFSDSASPSREAVSAPLDVLYRDHARSFEANRFVYPVLSRRSGGISIGVNLNPDKVCNFDCIYCQVDRVSQSDTRFVEMSALLEELGSTLDLVRSGELFQHPKFANVPAELRRLNDIAFSGDGEPTTYRNFDEIIAACAKLKDVRGLADVKMVLITNASMFHRDACLRGLETLMQHQAEIWAKLDAGDEEYYKLVERTTIPFQRILDNILLAAKRWPVVIQALFMRIEGVPPTVEQQEAFCDRLNEIVSQGGQISLVQIYTVARPPAESFVTPLSKEELDSLAERVESRTGLAVARYY